ncbi:hypothetical protein Tco_0653381 [Tanacetum coccineum]|uniref:Uncharacterized protein n=1 Tax=Tanacetum coccineum TaxID=301880 RepID=A0ABQ4X0E2_9ASTR
MTSPLSIIEIGIPQVSFDPDGVFLTDVEVEFPEASKLILVTFVRNLNVTPNTQVPSFGYKVVAAALWMTLSCWLDVLV